jgi:hypothetical protein
MQDEVFILTLSLVFAFLVKKSCNMIKHPVLEVHGEYVKLL